MSDFGHGVVVPLVLFTEHLHNGTAYNVEELIAWERMSPTERLAEMEANKVPELLLARMEQAEIGELLSIDLTVWALQADEYLAGLERSKAPRSLITLADHVRAMRHSWNDRRRLTTKDWTRVKELWQRSAMELDSLLGSQPEWTKY